MPRLASADDILNGELPAQQPEIERAA
jgi:hypothetical protein